MIVKFGDAVMRAADLDSLLEGFEAERKYHTNQYDVPLEVARLLLEALDEFPGGSCYEVQAVKLAARRLRTALMRAGLDHGPAGTRTGRGESIHRHPGFRGVRVT